MRFFEKFNDSADAVCPVCKTSNDKGRVLLVAVPGTEDGNTSEAQQFHESCAREVACALVQAMDNT